MADTDDAAKLVRDAEMLYQKTGQLLEEHSQKLKIAMENIAKTHAEVLQVAVKHSDELFTRSWSGMMERLGEQTTRILSESASRGMRLSLSSGMINDLKPGLGEAGKAIGSTLGEMAGGALGLWFGPAGAAIGAKVGAVAGGAVVGSAQMQLEGYRMLGARVTPVAYAGRGGADEGDFEKTGREYRRSIMEIVVTTGAAADAVEKLATALSYVGVGFLEGGKEASAFALAAERAMNIQPGVVGKLETRAIRQYGESWEIVKGQIDLVNIEVVKMNMLVRDQGNAIANTWKSADSLIDAMGQIESGVKNTSMSMESMNLVYLSLLDTMTKAGNVRPGAMVQTATNIMSALGPRGGKDASDEQRRSAAIQLLLERTGVGRGELTLLREKQKQYPGMGLASAAEMNANTSELGGAGFTMGMLLGVNDLAKTAGVEKTQTILGTMLGSSLSQTELARLAESASNLQKMGYTKPMTPKEIEIESAKNPEFKKEWENVKDVTERAKKQGEAQLSALDKIGNLLNEISIWTNGTTGQMRDRVGQTLGISKPGEHTSWTKLLTTDPIPGMLGVPQQGVSGGAQTTNSTGQANVRDHEPDRETIHIPDHMAKNVVEGSLSRLKGATSPGH
jgi:hypothetical protein